MDTVKISDDITVTHDRFGIIEIQDTFLGHEEPRRVLMSVEELAILVKVAAEKGWL